MEFEHMEYTPYGESWIDEGSNRHIISHRFTSKELDEETGLYYFGARYLDPQMSRWISPDPAMDGLNVYGYCANNPLKYIDPTGMINKHFSWKFDMHDTSWGSSNLGNSSNVKINKAGCYLMGFANAVATLLNDSGGMNRVLLNPGMLNLNKTNFAAGSASMDPAVAAKNYGLVQDYWTRGKQGDLAGKLEELHEEETSYSILAKVAWDAKNPDDANHWVGISGDVIYDEDLGEGGYVLVTGTSMYDKPGSRPSYWKEKDGNIYIPTSEIERIHTFTKAEE